ncbi:SHOCT domain-containing protein [Flavobacterium sp.]|uniref:SHOCT domain-containing protein n=1 Tax=Flavobacterium sp. TaxID=239 RepID=UPI003753A608
MHNYDGNFGGMHLIWWIIWVIFLIWIFVAPGNILGQRSKNDSPLDILKKRFANGEITTEEYEEFKKPYYISNKRKTTWFCLWAYRSTDLFRLHDSNVNSGKRRQYCLLSTASYMAPGHLQYYKNGRLNIGGFLLYYSNIYFRLAYRSL